MVPPATYRDAAGRQCPERRSDHALRAKVDQAFAIIAPFFSADQKWGGHSLDHMAYRVLREQMPSLTQSEVHVIVVAASRVFGRRGNAV